MKKLVKDLVKTRKTKKKEHEDEIEIPKKKYIKEHRRILKNIKPVTKEYAMQKKDLKKALHYKED